jgi:hypothetical protein
MDQATRLKRHTQLWSAGETSVRRIGIGGVIFALIVLLNVIEPYYIEFSRTQKQIETQESEYDTVKAERDRISEIQEKLFEMLIKIANEPWTDEIQKLKDDFSEGRVSQPHDRSKESLEKIAEQLQKSIVKPLRVATAQLPDDNPLAALPDKLDKEVVEWLDRYEDEAWWVTRDLKDDTARAIGEELKWVLNDASAAAPKIKAELEAAEKALAKQLQVAASEIEALKAELGKVIDRAMPTWARGIIGVDHLLVLYPWLLAGIAIYFVGTALRSSHHFHAMADGENWSTEERRDPLLSTSWTLTPRGIAGSIATFATYAAVMGVLGASLYRSQHPPHSIDEGSIQASVNAIAVQSSTSAMVAYAFFAAAIAVVIYALFRDRSEPPSA